jgi:hypothetical protein
VKERPKGLKPRNEVRAAKRYEENYGPKADWVRSLACVVSGSGGSKSDPIVAAHVLGRGAGGDSRDLVPMLASLHDSLHQMGQDTFAVAHNCDLEGAADIIELRWRQFVKDSE